MARKRERLDALLLSRQLASSIESARALIMAGEVKVDEVPVDKPGTLVSEASVIVLANRKKFVSRAGNKLVAALTHFSIPVAGLVCADVGSSTGGFTQVLLEAGAEKVFAIDTGYGELDWSLRKDPRVVVMERTNARYLESLAQEIQFACVDVSFISLKLVLPQMRSWFASPSEFSIAALIKPQFEAAREEVPQGGVLRDPEQHRKILLDMLTRMDRERLFPQGLIASPIKGGDGNTEFLVHLGPKVAQGFDITTAVSRALGL